MTHHVTHQLGGILSFDTGRYTSLSQPMVKPYVTSVTPVGGGFFSAALDAIKQVVPLGLQSYAAIEQARANRALTNINLDRLRAGQDTVDPTNVARVTPAPTVNVEAGPETVKAAQDTLSKYAKPVGIGIAVFAGLALLSNHVKGS